MDARVTVPSMDHPWMAGHLAFPLLSKYPWMPELLCHPWTIHGWPATLPSPLCLSIHGCQSYCAVHGPSMDGRPPCLHPSKYPWMPELLCDPWTIHGWPVTNCKRTVKKTVKELWKNCEITVKELWNNVAISATLFHSSSLSPWWWLEHSVETSQSYFPNSSW